MARIIHHIFANRSNVGDWLSAQGIQRLLAPLPVTEHLCDEPFVPQTLAALSKATPDDFIIIGGGGLFMNYFAPFWSGFRSIAKRVPFTIWGVGYCDLKLEATRPAEHLLRALAQQSCLCVVRDELTHGYLHRCSLPPPAACPSMLAVTTESPPITRRLLHVDHLNAVGQENYETMVRMAKAFAEETGRSYGQANNRIAPDDRRALRQTLDLYRSADLVLTSRLHGCIIALAMGRKVLAVSGDRKIESFMNAAGLADWVLDLDEIAALPECLHALSQQAAPVQFVERARDANRVVAQQVRCLMA
jgi:polysaccharide pyruvyl transferase WcaK-like protein